MKKTCYHLVSICEMPICDYNCYMFDARKYYILVCRFLMTSCEFQMHWESFILALGELHITIM
jgi:hypothetical protein